MSKLLFTVVLCVQFLWALNLKGQNNVIEGVDHYRLYVKFKADAKVDVNDGKVVSYSRNRDLQLPNLDKLLPGKTFSQLLPLTSEEKEELKSRNRSTPPEGKFDRLAFSGLVELEEARTMTPKELFALADTLESYDAVEYVQITPLTPPAPPGAPASRREGSTRRRRAGAGLAEGLRALPASGGGRAVSRLPRSGSPGPGDARCANAAPTPRSRSGVRG